MISYGNTLTNGFVYDDRYFVVQNEGIRSWSHGWEHFTHPDRYLGGLNWEIWRPIRNLSYTLDYSIGKLSPSVFHTTNLLLHLFNSCLVLLVIHRLSRQARAALIGALIFATHPVLTEAVGWIKGRDDLLSTAFFLLAVLTFHASLFSSSKKGTALWFCTTVSLALLSKEAALALIPTCGIILWLFAPECYPDARRRAIRLLSVGVALSVTYFLLRTHVLGNVQQADWFTGDRTSTWLTMCHVLVYYLQLALAPNDLTIDYGHFPVTTSIVSASFLISATILTALFILAIINKKRAPLITLGILWFFLNLGPVSNVVPTMQLLAERFIYLPMVGFCLIAGICLSQLYTSYGNTLSRARFLKVCAALILTLLMTTTIQRNRDWENDNTLYTSAHKVAPDNVHALVLLSNHHLENKRHRETRLLLDRPAVAGSNSSTLLRNLGVSLYATGAKDRGVLMLHRALELDPLDPDAADDLSQISQGDNDSTQAVSWLRESLRRDPSIAYRWANLSVILLAMERYDESAEAAKEALAIDSRNINALKNLTVVAWKNEDWDQAHRWLQERFRLYPNDQEAFNTLMQLKQRIESTEQTSPSP